MTLFLLSMVGLKWLSGLVVEGTKIMSPAATFQTDTDIFTYLTVGYTIGIGVSRQK